MHIQIILLLKSLKLFNTCTRFDILLQIASHVLAYTTACINPLYVNIQFIFFFFFFQIKIYGTNTHAENSIFFLPIYIFSLYAFLSENFRKAFKKVRFFFSSPHAVESFCSVCGLCLLFFVHKP